MIKDVVRTFSNRPLLGFGAYHSRASLHAEGYSSQHFTAINVQLARPERYPRSPDPEYVLSLLDFAKSTKRAFNRR